MIAEFVAISDAERRGRGHDRRTHTDKAADARRSGEPTDPARAEIRDAAAVGRETRLAQERIFREAQAAGARRRGDPRFVNQAIAEYTVMADADYREANARKARKALRAMRTGG